MGRSVLAHAYGVVSQDIYDGQLHERAHTHRILHIVREDKEGCAVGSESAVQVNAVAYSGHGVLADAKMEIGAQRIFRGVVVPSLHIALIAGRKVSASAKEVGLKLGYAVKHFA